VGVIDRPDAVGGIGIVPAHITASGGVRVRCGGTIAARGVIVLLTKTGPRCISFRYKITVSLAQGAVNDAEADVADPVFVRSTITVSLVGAATKLASDALDHRAFESVRLLFCVVLLWLKMCQLLGTCRLKVFLKIQSIDPIWVPKCAWAVHAKCPRGGDGSFI